MATRTDLLRRRPSDARAPRRPGEMPAYRVLAVMVATLCLAALVNADAMVTRAEHKPLGASRDRSLLVWNAVAAVSHVLQLSRIRDVADLAAGDDGPPAVQPAAAGAGPDAADAGPPVKPTVRTPSPDDKLKMLIVGDSVARDFGESLVAVSQAHGLVSPSLDYRIATGLARPDFFDWPAELQRLVTGTPPDVVVALFGANDAQGMLLPDGHALQSPSDPAWQAEYGRRVGAAMDLLRAPDRLVVWVGQPLMRDGQLSGDMALIDSLVAAEAATRPWVAFLDSRPLLADASGSYVDHVTTEGGAVVELRQADGIHLSRAGADLLANAVMDRLRAETGNAAL